MKTTYYLGEFDLVVTMTDMVWTVKVIAKDFFDNTYDLGYFDSHRSAADYVRMNWAPKHDDYLYDLITDDNHD
jgi:hypothetical protein